MLVLPDVSITLKNMVLVLDLAGTFVFALSGAAAGVRRHLDLFGILVLSFAAACSGGVARDVLIGAVPPAAFSDLRYLAVSMFAGLITFYESAHVERMRNLVTLVDSLGLALFAVAGAQKALAYQLDPVMAALLGMLTGIGGGMVRDVLLADIPMVLRAEIYALAALAGAGIVAVGHVLQLPSVPVALAGASVCFGLRLIAIRRGWQLPTARKRLPRRRG